jgi:integrase
MRRGHGEGSIYKRADGRWGVRLSAGFENGRRRQLFRYAKTQREAVRLLQLERQRLARAPAAARAGQTVEQHMSKWLDSIAKTKRPGTYNSYETKVRLYVNPVIGKVALSDLRPEHIDAVTAAATAAGNQASTVALLRTILSIALNRAMKWELLERNVVRLTDAPAVDRKERAFFDAHQAERFLEAVATDPLAAIFTVMICDGLRIGEALGLRWQHVDLERRQLTVRHSLHRHELGPPKTKESGATIDLTQRSVTALRRERARQALVKPPAGGVWLNEWDLVFTMPNGLPLCAETLRDRFHAIVAKAGLPRIRVHDLRHSCGSMMLAAGVPLKVVSEKLRHARIETTANIYLHVTPEQRRQAADSIDQALGHSTLS